VSFLVIPLLEARPKYAQSGIAADETIARKMELNRKPTLYCETSRAEWRMLIIRTSDCKAIAIDAD
jgi:hypothetical protein